VERLTVALPKGRLLIHARDLFQRLGCTDLAMHDDSRKLVYEDQSGRWRFILAKAGDVPIYVEHGAADVGIVGLDALRESGCDVYASLPLGFGKCRVVVAAPRARAARVQEHPLRLETGLRIATKYPRVARQAFMERGISVEIIGLSGSIELAPTIGLADLLVDIVDTGRTLRENGLVEIEELMRSEAYLIVNRASYVLKGAEVKALIEGFARLTQKET
jgi:ATP phosphoribosyltransferase